MTRPATPCLPCRAPPDLAVPRLPCRTTFPVKKLVNLTEEQARQISEFRYDSRLPSDNETIRRLIELGLEAARRAPPE